MSDFEFLGPYRVDAKLGQGGMGSVYRGVHRETGQRVAIKVLATEMAKEPRFRNRFASEIRTLEKLSHPNIVQLIAWPKDLDDPEKRDEYQGPLFYSMELVEGPSLLEHLRKVKRLDWDTTIGYAIEICSALKHAHDLGVIHRDLKPANLLLEPEGSIKLTDFGIAKLFGATEQTAVGSVLGTADYMAPEQASGGAITGRTDLYALGSLMYACLAGRPPFGGRNLTRVIHGLKHETPPPLDLVLPDVPPELAELIHELLEKQPEDRPPTALVISKRLKALRAGLRKRGELTRYDTDRQTLPEVVADKIATNPILRKPEKESVSDQPTAAELEPSSITGLGAPPNTNVSDETQASEFDSSVTNAELKLRQLDDAKPTSHDTLAENLKTHGQRPRSEEATESNNWISVVVLTALLLFVIGVIAWAFRKPSMETLIADFESQIDSENYDEARSTFEYLEKLYPDHNAVEELRLDLPNDDTDGVIRGLQRRIKFSNRLSQPLTLPEQAWLDAMSGRSKSPARSLEQLRAWLAVYDQPEVHITSQMVNAGSKGPKLEQLISLAKQEVERLEALPENQKNPQAEELQAWVSAGKRSLEGEQLEEFKKGVRELYQDKDWAKRVLEELDR